MKIEIIGNGCTICKTLFCNALEALRETGRKGRVVIVKDMRKIVRYGMLATPAIIINGVVVCSGRLVSSKEIMALLKSYLTSVV